MESYRPSLFRSFWQAGFESACQINRIGVRLDLIASTEHDRQANGDYARLRELGLLTARDGVRWHLIDRGGRYDFASVAPLAEAAARHGVQVIWNLFHYGWPDEVELLTPAFVERFADFSRAAARFLRQYTSAPPLYVPLNEISFFSWAAGDMAFMYPFWHNRGMEIKRQLVRAAVAGMEAIWEVDSRARFVHAEPVIHVVPPRERPNLAHLAAAKTASQYEVWDMLAGYSAPELGGQPRYLDILGVNFYPPNQWEYPDNRLRWEDSPRDERWLPFHQLLLRVHERYRRPLLITETSHLDHWRGPWLRDIAGEVRQALQRGAPVEGVCLYPAVSRPDWDNADFWHNSGLWDVRRDDSGKLRRILNESYAAELRAVMGADTRQPSAR